jgi:hypothetical protein
MPAYDNTPFKASPILLTAGKPEYLFGSFNANQSPTILAVTAVAVASDVATLYVVFKAGAIPAVGQLITVRGTVAGGSGVNVSNVALASVTINSTTGIGNVTYAATASNLSKTADGGEAMVAVAEVAETLAAGASIPVVLQFNDPQTRGERTVTLTIELPTNSVTSCAAHLQGALRDVDSEYTNIDGTGIALASGTNTYSESLTLSQYRFYRLNLGTLTGTGTIVAKIEV